MQRPKMVCIYGVHWSLRRQKCSQSVSGRLISLKDELNNCQISMCRPKDLLKQDIKISITRSKCPLDCIIIVYVVLHCIFKSAAEDKFILNAKNNILMHKLYILVNIVHWENFTDFRRKFANFCGKCAHFSGKFAHFGES